jgi:hypothetical protein
MSRTGAEDGGRRTGADERTARLRRAIEGLRAAGHPGLESVDLSPKSAHEALTRQMVSDLAADVTELKNRVNAMLWLVAGAVVVDVAMRLAGLG